MRVLFFLAIILLIFAINFIKKMKEFKLLKRIGYKNKNLKEVKMSNNQKNLLKLMLITTVILLFQLLLITTSFAKPMMRDLGTLGGNSSSFVQMNQKGQIIGNSYLADNIMAHAFIWENGKMTDLGTLGGCTSNVIAINEKGQVIGTSQTKNNVATRGFIWENGKMIDLGSLGGSYVYVTAINEAVKLQGHLILWITYSTHSYGIMAELLT